MTTSTGNQPRLELLKYTWDEYKYRHGLCWAAVYKVSAAVIALAMAPYLKPLVTKAVGCTMLVLPFLGTGLALYGIVVLRNELGLFAETKMAHQDIRNKLLLPHLEASSKTMQEQLTPITAKKTKFDVLVYILIGVLCLLSLANFVFLRYWIPQLQHFGER